MSTLSPKGPIADKQMDLFMVTVWVSAFIFVVVGGTLLWVVLRYREKPGDAQREAPTAGHGNPLVEISLIAASVLLLVIIAVPTLEAIWYMHDVPVSEGSPMRSWYDGEGLSVDDPSEVMRVDVTGHQWWWEFDYPQVGVTTANEMVLPAGKPIELNLRANDVIHSFWLPRIAGKVDLIPGRANSMWIQAGKTFAEWSNNLSPKKRSGMSDSELREAYQSYLANDVEGYYYGQCAEFCGESHARMLFRARVVSADAFEAWAADHREGNSAPGDKTWDEWYAIYDKNPEKLTGDVNEGLKLFMGRGRCASCHAVNGNPRAVGVAGPDLTDLAERHSVAAGWLSHRNPDGSIDREKQYDNLFRWIKHTEEVKPGNKMWQANGGGIGELDKLLTDEEVHKIATYLQTLR